MMTDDMMKFVTPKARFLELKRKVQPFASFAALVDSADVYYLDDCIIRETQLYSLFTGLMKISGDNKGYMYGINNWWIYNKYGYFPMLEISIDISEYGFSWRLEREEVSHSEKGEVEAVFHFRETAFEYIIFPDSIKWYIYSNCNTNVARLVTTVGIPEWYSFYAEDKEEIEDCENQIKEYLDTIAKNPPMKTKDPWDEADIIS